MYKPFWALLFILSCTYSAAFADDPTSEKLSDLFTADGSCKGWGGVAPAPSENECRTFIEAALKEQRSQVETGGDAVEGESTIAQEDQINAVNQVNEETTADASTENIESTESSDAVEETNERVEISESESKEPATPIDQEQAATELVAEAPEDLIEGEGVLGESTEAEPEELVNESDKGVPVESTEAEVVPTETTEAEPEETVIESTETEETTAESVETETQAESAEAEPEEVATEVEGTPVEVESATDSAEADSSPTESAETEAPPTELPETESSPTESTEAELSESIEENPSGIAEKEIEKILQEELAENVEGGIEETTEEAISAEEGVKDGSEDAAEESQEAETEPKVPISEEEQTPGNQPIEAVASEEVPTEQGNDISQEVGSEQVDDQESVEQEDVVAKLQDTEPEEIVEETIPESIEVKIPEAEEVESASSEPTLSESEPAEEQIKSESSDEQQPEQTENVPSEEIIKEELLTSETIESPETAKEAPVAESEESPIKAEESPAEDAVAPESQTEEVSEPQAEAVAVDGGIEEEIPEQEDLTLNIEIPENLRSRNHISEVLRLDSGSVETEAKLLKAEESTLKDLKRVYEAAIKPLEILYKYRDLSNRHFGDPEIFSKPLILFMGPWSGGKSSIINYLLDNEYKQSSLRTGAEPSPAYFNIVMWGDREEVMDGTQLAADWTFSGLQKFGQGLLDRLRGLRLNSPLLEKVNIVEIPGILEIRKQVERLFPLNDACQWFIDRADIIFLVYDPSKLDVGPETEAILDQLKGREYQTKIILNKADQVKPEELMRVQGTLIWNISPLMSSTEPPVMYSTSLWSHPYQLGSPSRLLFAQEKAFLKDLREAMEKRVENKISSARRFAVRVRNHAKMVDCYLTTYYNHKSFFGNKQKVSDDIIEHPQNYHIYEGLSTLTNISRYDLPDPDVYRDFFRLNPVYDFQQLASTCTYFKGCPINRLDVAIAYDLPELVGRYKKVAEDVKSQGKK